MSETVDAIYENGVLRLSQPLSQIQERARVRVTVEAAPARRHPLAKCVGSLPDEDAAEMTQVIDREFEQVNHE